MTQISNITEKHAFFKKLTCKTPYFKYTLVYHGQFKSENQNLWEFSFSRRPYYGIVQINVLFQELTCKTMKHVDIHSNYSINKIKFVL